MSKFKPQNVNMNDINKFVKSGAFDKQMKQHMPAIMEKVKKVDMLSRREATMPEAEMSAFADKVAMRIMTSNVTDVNSYLIGIKTATTTLGYEKGWVEDTLMPFLKNILESKGCIKPTQES